MEIVCSWTEKVLCRPVWSCSTTGSCGTWSWRSKRHGDKWQGSGLYIVFQVMACSDQKFPVFKACLITEQTSAWGIQRRRADVKPGLVLQSCSSLRDRSANRSWGPGLKMGKCTKFPWEMKTQPAITSRLVKLCLPGICNMHFIPNQPYNPFVWELKIKKIISNLISMPSFCIFPDYFACWKEQLPVTSECVPCLEAQINKLPV